MFVISIPVCFFIGAAAGFSAFYFPAHRGAPLNIFDLNASRLAMAAGAFATVTSSVALALRFRAVASMLVVAVWAVAILGILGARQFVKPGPEYFERHLGQEVFLVPWQYGPAGPGLSTDENPGEIGLSASLCVSNLKGTYDPDCRSGRQLYVLPKEKEYADFDIYFWRKQSSEMSVEPEQNGYQVYGYTYKPKAGLPEQFTRYFVRQDSQGKVTRLVVCRFESEVQCMHHSLVGNYWFRYDAPLAAGDVLDERLAALLESWRRK